MKRRLLALVLAVSLLAGAPLVSLAQDAYPSSNPPATTTQATNHNGLWGLLGLFGLFALFRKNRPEYRDRNVTTTGPQM